MAKKKKATKVEVLEERVANSLPSDVEPVDD